MCLHANNYFRQSASKHGPSELTKQRILYEMEKAYAPVRWNLPDDYLSKEAYEDALKRLDMTSSPGLPYLREAPTNKEWLGWNGVSCDPYKVERLWYDVQLVIERKFETILRVFIKQEPHKNSKIAEKRWRLIMAASLPVQIVWHMLFDYLNDAEIQNAYFIPSQQGVILVGGGWKQYTNQWEGKGLDWGLDKSAWDWTAPHWCIELDLEFRRRMGSGRFMAEWSGLARHLYSQMFEDPKLVLSDGTVWQQQTPGVMKSGCVNTISINSHCQVIMHLLYCLEKDVSIYPICVACGDDTLQHPKHCDDIEFYRKYGVIVKSASESREFVGHEFTRNGPHPLYMAKHMKKVRYVSEENLAQYFDSMARMYVHTRYYDIWEDLAARCGVPLPMSREAYRYWYDVEM